MMKSMQSAVTGLRAQQTAMDIIGNNIANVNTAGFKSSVVNFSDLFYQTLNGGTESVNPSQVGYGAQVSTVSKNMSSVGATTTDNYSDLYIDGGGYFTMNTKADGTGQNYYTRVGNFHFTKDGYLVDNSTGNFVMSTLSNAAGNYSAVRLNNVSLVDSSTTPPTVTPINDTNFGQLSKISINSDGSISASLNDANGKVQVQTGYAIPADGSTTQLAQDAADKAAAKADTDATDPTTGADAKKVLADAAKVAADKNKADAITAQTKANSDYATALAKVPADTTDPTYNTLKTAADDAKKNADDATQKVTDTTKLSDSADAAAASADAAAQTADAAMVKADAAKVKADFAMTIQGNPANYTLQQAQVSVFLNPDGLTEVGNNCLMANSSSGAPSVTTAGGADGTTIKSGELEMSNVDLAKEFTNMITTQRGFQANSRVITVSDTLLQELIDLKRS